MSLEVAPQRIPPVRAIVPLHNRGGQPYSEATVHRWIRICRVVYKAQKVDLVAEKDVAARLGSCPEFARELHLPVSLRSSCLEAPPDVDTLRAWGLFDVMLTPPHTIEHIGLWLRHCHEAGLPIRMQACIDTSCDVDHWRECGVVSANFVYYDPFSPGTPGASSEPGALSSVLNTAECVRSNGIEVNLIGFPAGAVPESLRANAVSPARYFADHQQYEHRAYRFATRLFDMSPTIAGKIIQAMQLRYTTAPSPVDRYFLEWLFSKQRFVYFWVLFFRKWFREREARQVLPRPFREERRASVDELDGMLGEDDLAAQMKQAFARVYPELTTTDADWEGGDAWYRQPKHYDAIDRPRAFANETQRAMADEARAIMSNRGPDEVVEASGYGVEDEFYEPLSNAVRWMTIASGEKCSNVVSWIEGPFTAAVTFAGGHAEYVGFRVGKAARMVCRMEDTYHRLALHVADDGSYVLMRDDKVIQPIEFEARNYAPARLSFPVGLQLCVINIDDHVSSQNVEIWQGADPGLPPADAVRYSVVVFCTRFSRRLGAVLNAIAHQRDIDLATVEVLVGYVPGVDTTDDVVDSIRLAHPKLRIVRVPFSEVYLKSKGFVINECARLAKGEWIMLLDADIVLPPDMFSKLESIPADTVFAAPPGRHMLDRATTARILLGEIKPWEQWDTLLAQSPNDRTGEAEGIPIGYCQIFRTTCLEQVQYAEYEHFEGADGDFGLAMRETFGNELRLEGATVLHLDHGGSQWFGTYRQQ